MLWWTSAQDDGAACPERWQRRSWRPERRVENKVAVLPAMVLSCSIAAMWRTAMAVLNDDGRGGGGERANIVLSMPWPHHHSQSIGAAASHRFDLEMEGITMLVTGHRAPHGAREELFPKLMYVVVKTNL